MRRKLTFTKASKHIILILISLCILSIISLTVYSSSSYQSLTEMEDEINNLMFTEYNTTETNSYIKYEVENPVKHILFVPGGLVEPSSYKYLATKICSAGYNVTIYKPLYNLAILTSFLIDDYLDNKMDNVIIGHSLGGVVGSMVASKESSISELVLLGSYPIKEINYQDVLIITAENDLLTDNEKINESLYLIKTSYQIENIVGGNHAQFGWYGPQKKDGVASISTINQQDQVVTLILEFIQ
ncbi:alpha/beta hydrolase [Candidatus Izimaplasma bacterium ZiA1]|uniref:alpha/beta hydrolase n=1 Tax=Candidatus Izimoplasma sp. ZiA1 TaxID=2024899 RepID=UPI00143A2B84